ncbi:hypothetical protein [Boudabousia liubingyangii]|uniref:hypothetical protein n=1 Tax=Boudabousia liubingyangii TaxID=1921764 RepID=UPI00093B68B5|nr:hypothetical protein [Boudabousia liubingyangii]
MSVWEQARRSAQMSDEELAAEAARLRAGRPAPRTGKPSPRGEKPAPRSGKAVSNARAPRGKGPAVPGTSGRGGAASSGRGGAGTTPRGTAGKKAGAKGAPARPQQTKAVPGKGGQGRPVSGKAGQAKATKKRPVSGVRPAASPTENAPRKPSLITRYLTPKQGLANLPILEKTAWIILYVVIIAGILGALVLGGIKLFGQPETHDPETGLPKPPSTSEVPMKVYRCDPKDVKAVLEVANPVAQFGQPVDFNLTLTNESSYPCTLEASSDDLMVKVTSGEDTYYESQCGTPEVKVPSIMLDPKASYQRQIVWKAHTTKGECQFGDPAPAGTYKASLSVRTLPELKSEVAFTIR